MIRQYLILRSFESKQYHSHRLKFNVTQLEDDLGYLIRY
jgi:hypothetical protein